MGTSFLKIKVDNFVESCIDTLTMVPIHKITALLNRSEHKYFYIDEQKKIPISTYHMDIE